MRPKIVILTLVIAFGVLGAVAVFKGMADKHAAGDRDSAATNQDSTAATSNIVAVPTLGINSTNSAADDVRAAVIDKELERISTLREEADGTNNPTIIAALLEKMANPEAQVRKGVVDALVQLNDTNAVPGMQKAVESIQDPREKVAILDAIEYIKAPDIMAGVPPEVFTNSPVVSTNLRSVKPRSGFMRGKNNRAATNNGGAAPAPAPAAQPQ